MKKSLTLSKQESAGLRFRMENHLTGMFANNSISKYLVTGGCDTELQLIPNCPDYALAYPQVKLAYHAWLGMHVADRHAVLGKFHNLYSCLSLTNTGNRKTLTFCAIFINEFAAILVEAMEWPD